jgi:hypothetical protein
MWQLKKTLVTTRLMMECFWPPSLWQPKAFCHQSCGDEKVFGCCTLGMEQF